MEPQQGKNLSFLLAFLKVDGITLMALLARWFHSRKAYSKILHAYFSTLIISLAAFMEDIHNAYTHFYLSARVKHIVLRFFVQYFVYRAEEKVQKWGINILYCLSHFFPYTYFSRNFLPCMRTYEFLLDA